MLNLNESLFLITGAFDLFPDAVIIVNKEGVIKNANKQIFSVFGYTESEIIEKPLTILLPERFRDKHHHFVSSFFSSSSIRKMGAGVSLFGQHKLGHEVNIDIALSVIETNSEKYSLAVIRDITDKMNLMNKVNSVETIKNELEQFAYVLTHDLKAPLNRVKALTQLINLELNDKESKEIKSIVNYINDSVDGMEKLITGVLEYHKTKLNIDNKGELIDLNEIYEEVLKLIVCPANFKISVHNVLPIVNGNRTMLIQVFLNLITNAINHNNKTNGILEIDWYEKDGFYYFSFSDNGTVIPQERRETIFDITAQLGNTYKSNTHGLGLSIVRQIIEKNEGAIKYEPSQLNGSSFVFSWPGLNAQ